MKEKAMTNIKKKKGIKEFFGLKEPFFITNELRGKDLLRFADREEELQDLKIAVELNRNYAVIGDTGTGKSSLLLKFLEEIKDSYYTDYIYFSMDARTDEEMKEEHFRNILTGLLTLIVDNDKLMDHYDPKEIDFEIKRLNFSISIEDFEKKHAEITPEVEANFPKLLTGSILPIKLAAKLEAKIGKEKQKTETRTFEKHTETTLRKAIDKITQKLPAPVVLFIDEMDRMFKAINPTGNWINEVIKLLQFTTEIMTNKNLIFIFAMQPEIYDIFAKAYRGEGDDSILKYVQAFKKIAGFDMDFARSAVEKSLKFAGYKEKIGDLFEAGILETVLTAVKSNPRQFMLSLTDLTILAYKKNHEKVTRPILKEFLLQKFGETGPEEWRKSL